MTDASSNRVACPSIGPSGGQCELKPNHRGSHASLTPRESWQDAIPNRATVCERCGSGLLDGKHIASYPPCNGEDAIPNSAAENPLPAMYQEPPPRPTFDEDEVQADLARVKADATRISVRTGCDCCDAGGCPACAKGDHSHATRNRVVWQVLDGAVQTVSLWDTKEAAEADAARHINCIVEPIEVQRA